MTIRVRLANRAESDIRDIRAYSKQLFGPAVARQYLLGLRGTFELLADQPEAGGLERDLGSDIRGFTYRSHRLFYRIKNGDILIIRILHHARDVAAIMERKE